MLADRCLPVPLRRKTTADAVSPFRSHAAEAGGERLRAELESWAAAHGERLAGVYDRLEPFDIDNDRMAELLLPQAAVLTVAAPDRLADLQTFADRWRPSGRPQVCGCWPSCREEFAVVRPTPADVSSSRYATCPLTTHSDATAQAADEVDRLIHRMTARPSIDARRLLKFGIVVHPLAADRGVDPAALAGWLEFR